MGKASRLRRARASQADSDALTVVAARGEHDYRQMELLIHRCIADLNDTLISRPAVTRAAQELMGPLDLALFLTRDGGQVVGAINSHVSVSAMHAAMENHDLPWVERLRSFRLLEHLAVTPTHRKMGVGAHLVSAAEELHRASGAEHWGAYVHDSEARALPFYDSCGFTILNPGQTLPGYPPQARPSRPGRWVYKAL